MECKMNDIAVRYSRLNKKQQKVVDDLIEKLSGEVDKTLQLEKKEKYKKLLLSIPQWSEEDLKIYDEVDDIWKKWTVETW
jgi:hypothetical protein